MYNWCLKPSTILTAILVEFEELNLWYLDRLALGPTKAVALIVRLGGIDWIDLLRCQQNL